MAKMAFTVDELHLMVILVERLDPEQEDDPELKAVIYKCKAMTELALGGDGASSE